MASRGSDSTATPWWALKHESGTRFRDIGGYRISVRPPPDGAACTGPDVFLLHGMADASDTWNACLPALQGCRVWRFDLPWSGRDGSAWPDILSAPEWLQVAFELCPVERGIAIAHSFASTALLDHQLRDGGTQMDALVLMSPFYCSRVQSLDWDEIDRYARGVHARFVDALRIRLGSEHCNDDVLNAMAAKLSQRVLPDGVMALFQLYLRSRTWALKSLAAPVSIIVGDSEGPMVTRGARALADALPAVALHTLPDCGHYPMHEQPVSLNHLLRALLAEHSPASVLPTKRPADRNCAPAS